MLHLQDRTAEVLRQAAGLKKKQAKARHAPRGSRGQQFAALGPWGARMRGCKWVFRITRADPRSPAVQRRLAREGLSGYCLRPRLSCLCPCL